MAAGSQEDSSMKEDTANTRLAAGSLEITCRLHAVLRCMEGWLS